MMFFISCLMVLHENHDFSKMHDFCKKSIFGDFLRCHPPGHRRPAAGGHLAREGHQPPHPPGSLPAAAGSLPGAYREYRERVKIPGVPDVRGKCSSIAYFIIAERVGALFFFFEASL